MKTPNKARDNGEGGRDAQAYSCLLKNELLGEAAEDIRGQSEERRALTPVKGKNLFQVRKIGFFSCFLLLNNILNVCYFSLFLLLKIL